MKQYISVNGGDVYIEYDSVLKTSKTIIISEVNERLAEINAYLETHENPSDELLLFWAKEHYPNSSDFKETQAIIAEKETITNLLEEINGN